MFWSRQLLFAHFFLNNRYTKPIPLAEVSSVQLPSVQILVYSQATAQSFPHLKRENTKQLNMTAKYYNQHLI